MWPEPMPLAPDVVATDPVPIPPVVLEPESADERNPLGLTIHHRDGACPEPEACAPRLKARCRGCRCERVLCTATNTEVRAMMRRGWVCGDCDGAS